MLTTNSVKILLDCFHVSCIATALGAAILRDAVYAAADLTTIGGLPTLLSLLQDPHASLRWRAAEVVATCVQNNPPVQQVISTDYT